MQKLTLVLLYVSFKANMNSVRRETLRTKKWGDSRLESVIQNGRKEGKKKLGR
jgi:hypothetical protein